MSAVWTQQDIERLQNMIAARCSINRMVVRLGRSRRAIVEQMRRRPVTINFDDPQSKFRASPAAGFSATRWSMRDQVKSR